MRNENRNVVKRNVKDSVFCNLFSDTKYQLMIYRILHPEDFLVSESDITTVTLESVIVNDIYNDLGFMVHERLMILIEEQSSWSINIVIRVMLYLAAEWKKCIHDTAQSPYSSKKLKLPRPEFYVIYTGRDKMDIRNDYYLAEEFFDGDSSFLDARVKVIRDSHKGDIINQYVTFTRVLDDKIRAHGRTKQAILETIRICTNSGILEEYLTEHEQEVFDMVDVLYDVEWNRKILNKQDREEARQEGENDKSIKVYNNCLDRGMSEADAISLSEISDEALAVARKRRSERH
ncbi:MAG: hypothetical protein PUG04_05100 [Lachnospiraceae bacterium]|nr:hypothetical protein [Lachnospiraceae bacterium]